MGRKLIVFTIMLIMTFQIFALTSCDSISLANYKKIKSQELQDYKDAKKEENYCTNRWEDICRMVTAGKTAIENSTTKSAVTKAFNDAMMVIDEIQEENEIETISSCGRFSIKVSIDKTIATVGEVIKISAVFRNLTDQDIKIEVIDHVANAYGTQLSKGDLQQLIEIALLPYGRYPDIQTILCEGFTIVLPKEALVERAVEVSISEKGKHWILAGVTLFVGENRQEPVSVFMHPITVYVI